MRGLEIGSDLALNVQQDMRLLQGYDPSVDYDTGTGWNDAVSMYRADKPAEKQAYLANKYGAENVFTDRGGRFVVRGPEGKLQAVEGDAFNAALKQGGARLYADLPLYAGAAGGAIAGMPLGPGGAVSGAIAGGALGKGAIEATKTLAGEQRKTIPELAASIGLAGLYEGAGEAGGRLVTGLAPVAGRLFRERWAHVTPESRELANLTLRSGGRVPIGSVAPGLGPAALTEDVATRLGSNYTDIPNLRAVEERLGRFVDEAMPGQRAPAMAEILDPAAAVSSREAGVPILGGVRLHVAQLEGEVDNLARDADRMLTQQLSQLSAVSRRAPARVGGDLGLDLAGGLSQARADFSRAMERGYSQIDRLVTPLEKPQPQAFGPNREMTDEALFGVPSANRGAPVPTAPVGIVPTPTMKRAAGRILDSLPKDDAGAPIFSDARVLRALNQLRNAPDKMPLGETQRIRTILGELGEFTDMMPGVAKRDFNDLRYAVNSSIQAAARDPAAGPAIRLLRKMDETYAEGIRKFGDAQINQLVAQAKTGIMPDPGVIADKVLAPGNLSRARTMREMVGPDVWKRVASADLDNMIGPGGSAVDPQTGEVIARKFATLLAAKDKSGMLELTYGPGVARQMRLFGQRLDARGGKIPADALPLDNFGHNMRAMDVAMREREGFLSNNYLSELADPKKMPDDATDFVLQPGKEERLIQAQRFFGDDSPQMAAIRQQALKEVMHSAIVRNDSGSTITIAGPGIEKAMEKWTGPQQEIMFPNGLANDMKLLGQEIRFMFPRVGNAFAGGLAAGNIGTDALIHRIVPSATFTVPAWIMTRPSVTRVIANGLAPSRGRGEILSQARQDIAEQISDGRIPRAIGTALLAARPTKAEMREVIRMLFRAEAAGQLPHPDEEPEPGVMSALGASGEMMQRSTGPRVARPPILSGLRPARDLRPSVSGP
jgi:hypothetical protein